MTTCRSSVERELISDLDRSIALARLLAIRDRQLRVACGGLERVADGDGASRRTAALTLAALRHLEHSAVR